jgi:hypothetical protein
MQEKPTLIVPRRNFLVRALGFTAAGATMPISIITASDAKARMEYHQAELTKAWEDYYGPAHNVRTCGERLPVGAIEPASARDGRTFPASYGISVFMIAAGGGELDATKAKG